MHLNKTNIDSVSVTRQTSQNCRHISDLQSRLADYDEDSQKKARLQKALCRYCMYYATSRIGGAAVSSRSCSFCETTLHSGNTNVDILCVPCATKHEICCRCGADLHDRVRRRKFDLPKTESEVKSSPGQSTWFLLPKNDCPKSSS